MNRKEMLQRLGLSEQEHTDLLAKFAVFHNSLNENQKRVVRNSMPTTKQASKSFGPGVTSQHIQSFNSEASAAVGLFSFTPGIA